MDAKSQETLELGFILERLSTFAAFSASKELALSLQPSSDRDRISRWQRETSEAGYLLSVNSTLSIGGAHDVRPQAEGASRGIVLEPMDLLDIKSTMIAARNLKRTLASTQERAPLLAEHAEEIAFIPGLVDSISKVLDERGKIKDNASEKLATIRKDLRIAKERLTSKLERMIEDQKIVAMLQDAIITQRDGRYVIPLRAEFKGRIEAVIHDRSSSGATLFIEPLTVVDLNNQLKELELAERDEIRRLLAELSRHVGEGVREINLTVEILANLDLSLAKAKYAESIQAVEPVLVGWENTKSPPHPGSTLRLIAARHPLLDPKLVVPIDVILDEDTFALVITGPNTGGKTVALKTVGLLTLMTQCGLHIPAQSGSESSIFDGIYADIGDEQSIEQSLSTFSAHISNVIRIQGKATSNSLVLLDELGAGTDPQEGAALAKAILSQFLKNQTTTLVATHYPEMKVFAHASPGVRNASVEFDLESLQPTYHLTIGLPGRSNALAIAERLGLDNSIVENARRTISPEELRTESLLDEIHRQKGAAREELQAARKANEEVQDLKDELQTRLEDIDVERRELLNQARLEGQKRIEELEQEIASLRMRLAKAAQPLEVLRDLGEKAGELETDFVESFPVAESEEGEDWREVRLGDHVHIRTIDAKGVVTELGSDYAEVQVGRLRIRTKLEELSYDQSTSQEKEISSQGDLGRGRLVERTTEAPPLELDLRGQTVEDALAEVDKRLDAAYLAGMPFVLIIHGKGTGRLRAAIRTALKDNTYVSSFEPGHQNEGGDGVTRVKLASS